MVQKFDFESESDYVDWYFENCYPIIENKYSKWFGRKIIIKVVKGIHKSLVENLKERENKKSI